MNTLTIGKLHKIVVHRHYSKIIDIDGYKSPKEILYSEHIDVFITEPFLVLEIKKFKTGYNKFGKKMSEPWVKILIPNKNIVCWVEKEKLTMWSNEGNASIVEIMKIQTTRQILNKVLDHYRDTILQKFPYRFITPSSLTEMDTYLKNYQTAMIQRETNPIWAIPLKIIFDQKRNVIDLIPDEQAILDIIG